MTLERVFEVTAALLLAGVIGFSVWLLGFDNGGCPQGQTAVVTGYTTIVIVGKYGPVVDEIPRFRCEQSPA